MRWKISLFTLFILFIIPALYGQQLFNPDDLDKIISAEQRNGAEVISFKESSFTDEYDLLYFRANWKIDPRIRFISGQVTYYLRAGSNPIQSLYFDCSDSLNVYSFLYHGSVSTILERPGGDLLKLNLANAIEAGAVDSVTITYEGKPADTGFGSFTQSSHNGDSIIYTLSEPYGAKDWFPCKNSLSDKIDSIDILVEMPAKYRVGTNGVLVENYFINDTSRVMHWQSHYPIAMYLIGIAITNYSEFDTYCALSSGDTVPVIEYVYPEDSAYYSTHPGSVISMIQLYSTLFGDYPFKKEKYGHAQWNWGGGEEHQTMSFVTFPDIFELIAHELGHQWFGDKVTCGSWQDIWLNEGFATYLAGLSYENLSPQYWLPYKETRLYSALHDSTGSVFCADTTDVARIFSSALTYSKGMFLLHMLRWKLGDEIFFKAIYDYINDTTLCYGFARTSNLKQHLEDASGINLDEFFNDWFYGKGYPTYHIKWANVPGGMINIAIHQTQNNPSVSFYEMPVPIKLKDATHDTTIVIQNNLNDMTYTTGPLSFTPDSLFFDPEIWLLSKNTVEKDELLAQPLIVFPNPATNTIQISFHEIEDTVDELTIYDVMGRKMISIPATNVSFYSPVTVDISNLSGGYYFLDISTTLNHYVQRIIKF